WPGRMSPGNVTGPRYNLGSRAWCEHGRHGRACSPDPEGAVMPSDAIRLVKVPDAAPPYDCPVHGARCPERAADGAPGRASAGRALAGRALAGRALAGGHPSAVSRAAGTRDPGSRAPVAGPAAALALVLVETLAGGRPEPQVSSLT